jgi:O-Antigen ligase
VSRSAFGRAHRAAAGSGSAACALGFGCVVLLGYRDGGYYPETWSWAALAFGALAGLQLLLRRVALSGLEWLSLAGFAALAAWMLLSALWGIDGTEARREAERCGLYALGLGALLIVVRASAARALLVGVLGGAAALAMAALAHRVVSPPGLDPYQGALLRGPVGYANALGILMAIGVVLALGMLRAERRRAVQIVLVGAASVCGVALALTSSRGAWLATAVGVVVLGAFRTSSTIRRRPLTAASIAAVVGATIFLLVLPRMSFGDRPAYWTVSTHDAAGHVLLGSGAGSFDDYWRDHRPIPAYVRDAHSLYLETAAELGLVGVALLLCALGAPLAAAPLVRDRSLAATAAAAYAAFLVHAGLDWDWEMPVTTVAGLACGAALLVAARRA